MLISDAWRFEVAGRASQISEGDGVVGDFGAELFIGGEKLNHTRGEGGFQIRFDARGLHERAVTLRPCRLWNR